MARRTGERRRSFERARAERKWLQHRPCDPASSVVEHSACFERWRPAKGQEVKGILADRRHVQLEFPVCCRLSASMMLPDETERSTALSWENQMAYETTRSRDL